jgi:hypothetical protein
VGPNGVVVSLEGGFQCCGHCNVGSNDVFIVMWVLMVWSLCCGVYNGWVVSLEGGFQCCVHCKVCYTGVVIVRCVTLVWSL